MWSFCFASSRCSCVTISSIFSDGIVLNINILIQDIPGLNLFEESILHQPNSDFDKKNTLAHKSLPHALTSGPKVVKFCQMLSWWAKNWPHFINIWDTVTPYEPNLTLLAWFLQDLAYLRMLFVLEVLCTAGSTSRINNMLK